MGNSTFIEEERPKSFWQEKYEELREKYDQLLKSKDVKSGIELIAEERKRQIEFEGYTPQHDFEHTASEMISAAQAYLHSADLHILSESFDPSDSWHKTNEPFYWNEVKKYWPWDEKSFKPTTTLRDLVKAGAVIAAVIDRLNARKEE